MKATNPEDEVRYLNTVYHVGNLEKDRETPHFSFEGRTLSVSVHPEDWRYIAKLGTNDTYRLCKEDGVFLDGLETDEEMVRQWCIENSFVRPATAFKARRDGQDGYTMFYTKEEARGEAYPRDNIEKVDSVEIADKGTEYWEEAFTRSLDDVSPVALDELMPLWYAEAQGYDGVWWEYDYIPSDLSCPCGGIFQSKLDEWDITLDCKR